MRLLWIEPAKSFRDLVQSKMVQQEKKQINKWAYGAGIFLTLILLIIGVTAINNYDRMRAVQSTMETISNSIAGKEEVQAKETEVVKKEEEKDSKINKEEKTEKVEAAEEDSHKYDNGFYIVEKGDTLEKISRKAYGDTKHIEAISKMNGLENGNLIYIGQKLLLP